jgi:cation transport ATPase
MPAQAHLSNRHPVRVIAQNVWLAFGLSVVMIALAEQGLIDPLMGALSQIGVVLAVVANGARIL